MGPLWAAELDADRALGRWLRDREAAIRTIAERGTYFDAEDVDGFLSLAFPGVDELVGLVELVRLAKPRPVDRVVVDTAPTGHMLRLLAMPDTLARLAEVLDDMHAKHRFLGASLGGRYRADFADAAIAAIEDEAKALSTMLAERTSFTWVTLAEELPLRETTDGIAALAALGIRAAPVVVNRVSEPRGLAGLRALAASVRIAAPLRAPPAPRARRSQPHAPEKLPIRDTVRLVLFGGKGGVGKTTTSAAEAIALAEARPDARVFVPSTDPAHSLGDAFDVALGDDPRPIPGGPANLVARELDAARAWDEQRTRYSTSSSRPWSVASTSRSTGPCSRICSISRRPGSTRSSRS